jgi:hypothetical protein
LTASISLSPPRRNHTPAFKAKVAFAAIKGDRMLAQLEEYFDEPEWDADGYFLDTFATILDSIFLRPYP